ncbi:MAG TPA: hypothetical protein VGX24_14105 [Pyrinomonadaceae bacterium]|jgi:hypothetical protein|nr:hypothetical protein [Pyrinomonadaceae bacterium]
MSAIFPDETTQPFDPELPLYRVEGFIRDSFYLQTLALPRTEFAPSARRF